MILTRAELVSRLSDPNSGRRLVVTPLLYGAERQIGPASVDLALGEHLLLGQPSELGALNPARVRPEDLGAYLRRAYVPLGQHFALHVGQFALASTMEYIKLPPDLAGYVLGRSRWARVGLVIAMAAFVHPTFCGTLTMELQNLGNVPIELFPGTLIAQLVLMRACPPCAPQPSRFQCSVRPEFPPELLTDDEHKLTQWAGRREPTAR
jgi:dCTP deaminase